MKKEETILQDKIRDYLNEHKIFHIRYSAQSTANGIPDLIICYKGIFIGVELKTENGKPTDLQLKKLDSVREAGGIGAIICSLKDLVDIFEGIDWRSRGHVLTQTQKHAT